MINALHLSLPASETLRATGESDTTTQLAFARLDLDCGEVGREQDL